MNEWIYEVSRQWHSREDELNRVSSRAQVDTRMVGVARRRCLDAQGEFVFVIGTVVLAETKLASLRVVLNIDDVVDGELEGLEGRVELLFRVRPTVPVGADQVTTVADVGIVEVVLGVLDALDQAYADAHPASKLLHLDAPAGLANCIPAHLHEGRGSSIRPKRSPLDSIPLCSAIMPLSLILAPLRVVLHFISATQLSTAPLSPPSMLLHTFFTSFIMLFHPSSIFLLLSRLFLSSWSYLLCREKPCLSSGAQCSRMWLKQALNSLALTSLGGWLRLARLNRLSLHWLKNIVPRVYRPYSYYNTALRHWASPSKNFILSSLS